jgi:hypothetical protein
MAELENGNLSTTASSPVFKLESSNLKLPWSGTGAGVAAEGEAPDPLGDGEAGEAEAHEKGGMQGGAQGSEKGL